MVANYLDGEYTDFDACFPFTNVVTGNGCAPIQGQQLQRQPKLRYMLTPSYRFPLAVRRHRGRTSPTRTSVIARRISPACSSSARTTPGTSASPRTCGDNWQFSLRGTNVTDELGLTESNSRIFGVAAGTGGVLLARPLEGSEINFQAKYRW